MPNTKFSFAALREHLRKFLWIYIIGVAACLLMTNLLWTTTAPRTPMEQVVQIYLADDYTNADNMPGVARAVLERTQPFDDTLEEVEFLSVNYTADDYYSAMLLMTRLTTGDADAFLCNQAVLDYLIGSGASLALDDFYAEGWLEGRNVEPYFANVQEDEASEPYTILAAMKLGDTQPLARLGAMVEEDVYMVVTVNGTNVDTTVKALENMIDIFSEEAGDAQAEAAEPAA